MRRGFTLVELMIVLTLTGIIAGALFHLVADRREGVAAQDDAIVWASQARVVRSKLKADAAEAAQIVVEPGAIALTLPDTLVTYEIETMEGRRVLLRSALEGEVSVHDALATDVAGFEITREGRRVSWRLSFEAKHGTYRAAHEAQGLIALEEGVR